MKRSKGIRNRNRTLLRRKPRDKGKNPLGRLLIPYSPGQMVTISINPSVQKGMPHRRYHGRVGTIAEKRGRAYVIEVASGKFPRLIIARPEHILPIKEKNKWQGRSSKRRSSLTPKPRPSWKRSSRRSWASFSAGPSTLLADSPSCLRTVPPNWSKSYPLIFNLTEMTRFK